MDKEIVKKMLFNAIDNIPNCATITDCYVEHSYVDIKALFKVVIELKDDELNDDNKIEFHNIAHNAFDSDMDLIS